MNNTLEGINSRTTDAEEWISDLEDRMLEITAANRIEKRMKKKKMKTEHKNFFEKVNFWGWEENWRTVLY